MPKGPTFEDVKAKANKACCIGGFSVAAGVKCSGGWNSQGNAIRLRDIWRIKSCGIFLVQINLASEF